MNAKALNLTSVTTAVLVAGRTCMFDRRAKELVMVCERVDALAAELGVPLVVVFCTDLPTSCDNPDPSPCSAIVGLLVAAAAHPEPKPVDAAALETALSRADALRWQEIRGVLGELDGDLDTESHLYLCATGPLAGGVLAYGVPGSADDERHSAQGVLEFCSGKDSEQDWLTEGVWGMKIEYVGDWGYDWSNVERAVRDEGLRQLLPEGAGFHLMAAYD